MEGFNIVGVQFRRAGKIYDFMSSDFNLRVGDEVVVETERGPSLAEIVKIRFEAKGRQGREYKPILRKAGRFEGGKKPRLTPEYVSDFCREMVAKLELKMNVLKSEVQLGGNKVIVYFTAPGRVDFRELVKELAGGLKTRVELKQIGARDETKLIGGVGICGREYCCSSFLREFVPVSIKMAKNQNLALNPSKVSGGCGRLLCCLTYENATYTSLRRKLPGKGAIVADKESGEQGRVIKSDILNQLVVFENELGQLVTAKVNQIKILDKKQKQKDDDYKDNDDNNPNNNDDNWGEDLDLDALTDASK